MMSNPFQLKNPDQNEQLTRRLYDSATLSLTKKERREQRISNLLSIADDPSSPKARKEAEKIIDEIY